MSGSRLKSWFRRSWFACERFAERESQRRDRTLSLLDALGHRFHYLLCRTCRHVAAHWAGLEKDLEEFGCEHTKSEGLSSERADRIREMLRSKKTQD